MRYLRTAVIILFIVCLGADIGTRIWENKTEDTSMPEFMLASDEPLYLSVNDEDDALLSGIYAADEKDGDLTDEIIVSGHTYFTSAGTCQVKYYVFDSDNNCASCTRTVTYTDYTSPVFEITDPLTYAVGNSAHVLDYLKAQDVLDGDLTSQIVITENNTDTTESGVYTVTAQVTNSYGDIAEITFGVVVRESNSPSIMLTENVIYLSEGDEFSAEEYIGSAAASSGEALYVENDVMVYNENGIYLDSIEIEGEVDTSKEGCYQVVYSLNLGSGTGKACLSVVVR